MFGGEVADVGMSYISALARETFQIDRGVRNGEWPKPRGLSLSGRTLGLVGMGDIGRNLARRALASDMKIVAYDPFYKETPPAGVEMATWPQRIGEADFIAFTCALTPSSHHMLNADVLKQVKQGVRIVNVARGPLIDEPALIQAMQDGVVHSVGLDVFEVEPLPMDSPLRSMPNTIFGSHNGSNTVDGVVRCSLHAIDTLFGFLGWPRHEHAWRARRVDHRCRWRHRARARRCVRSPGLAGGVHRPRGARPRRTRGGQSG